MLGFERETFHWALAVQGPYKLLSRAVAGPELAEWLHSWPTNT